MKDVDWPLAITLAVAFVVLSAARWRFFRARARRQRTTRRDPDQPG